MNPFDDDQLSQDELLSILGITKKELTQEAIDEQLQEIKNTRIRLDENKDGNLLNFDLSLPYNCGINGYIDQNTGELYIQFISVPQELEGHGIGSRLMKTLKEYAIKRGATFITGNITSERALHLRAKIFGEENMSFFDKQGTPLNISYDQATQSYSSLKNKFGGELVVRSEIGS